MSNSRTTRLLRLAGLPENVDVWADTPGSQQDMNCVAVILAAGLSTRMGTSKPLVRLGHRTFLEQILSIYTDLRMQTVVVLGNNFKEITQQIDLNFATVLRNPEPEAGPLSSLKLALSGLSVASALIMHPVDHPLVSKTTVGELLRGHRRAPGTLLIPSYAGRKGHPVLFPRRFFPDIRRAPLEKGARWVFQHHPASIQKIPVTDPGILINIDTPQELKRVQRLVGNHGRCSAALRAAPS